MILILIVNKVSKSEAVQSRTGNALCKLKVSLHITQCLLQLNNDLTFRERIITVFIQNIFDKNKSSVVFLLVNNIWKYKIRLTSLVFHLCLWEGKWSDLGRDSKLSGSFIGSPSKINIFILHQAHTKIPSSGLLAVTYILMVNFKDV